MNDPETLADHLLMSFAGVGLACFYLGALAFIAGALALAVRLFGSIPHWTLEILL